MPLKRIEYLTSTGVVYREAKDIDTETYNPMSRKTVVILGSNRARLRDEQTCDVILNVNHIVAISIRNYNASDAPNA